MSSPVLDDSTITSLLDSCGFNDLGTNPSLDQQEAVLQKIEAVYPRLTRTAQKPLFKREVIKRLTAARVPDAAELVDAVCEGGHSVLFAPAEPLPGLSDEDGNVLLDELETVIRRYIVLTDDQIVAVVLWIALTYAIAAFSKIGRAHV